VIFALGETFMSPSLGPIVNDLAPDDLRGRYNGLYTLGWTTGFALGPAIGAALLDLRGSGVFAALVLVCGAVVWGAGRLDPLLPSTARTVPDHRPSLSDEDGADVTAGGFQ
jgi:MFS family permease